MFDENEIKRWLRAVDQYVHLLSPWESDSKNRLIEIGSSKGRLLKLAELRGWEPTGVEISSRAADYGKEEFELELINSGWEDFFDQNKKKADVILASHLIEHLSDPSSFVKQAKHHLKKTGKLIIETPNWESRDRHHGKEFWIGINEFHVTYFSPDLLKNLLERNKFTVEHTYSYNNQLRTKYARRGDIHRYFPLRIVNALYKHSKISLERLKTKLSSKNLPGYFASQLDQTPFQLSEDIPLDRNNLVTVATK